MEENNTIESVRANITEIKDDSIHETLKSSNGSSAKAITNYSSLKYFILAPPQYTDSLLDVQGASEYYQTVLNEESVEIWLHRAFQQGTYEEGHTLDPSEADVFLIAGYFHLNHSVKRPELGNQTDMIQRYQDLIINATKPHLLLSSSLRSNDIGIKPLSNALREDGVDMYSVGIERNEAWQGVPQKRIVPVPYVVRQTLEQHQDQSSLIQKISNSVFYSGDARQNAQKWGGCFREKMILPLQENSTMPNVDVRIVGKHNRLDQAEYNHRMITSEYCLILCGDTPTSRSLTSAMVSGCIPILVGSRLKGLCEPPCKGGFGWQVSGEQYPHLAFPEQVPWNDFPEVNEADFTANGEQVLQDAFAKYDISKKEELRAIMAKVREGWIYGWGNPVTSTSFGHVHRYLWEEFQKLVT